LAIDYEKKGHIAYIHLNRPEVLNAINMEGRGQLAKYWANVRDDDDVWMAIVYGAGERAFSAGQDLKEVGALLSGGQTEANMANIPSADDDPLINLRVWKPFIAAIRGICTGAGMELAMACDIRIAAEDARLGLAETKRAVIPGGGGTQRLPRLVPMTKAIEMLMTGDFIDAQEAYRIGLVNKVVPVTDLLSSAEAFANDLCLRGPLAVRAVKELAYKGMETTLVEGLKLEAELVQKMFQTEDVMEGMMSFSQKRDPQYKGK